jgi:hypothetical protein
MGGGAVNAEVIAQSEESSQTYKVTTDSQRRFLFAGVKPGTYRLFAKPGIDTFEYRNPVILASYANDSTEVEVSSDTIASVIELTAIEK